jgi:hypothetical protein
VFSLDESGVSILMEERMEGNSYWLSACMDGRVFSHEKLDIQRMSFEVMRNVLFRVGDKEVRSLCGKFDVMGVSFREVVFGVW